jgi:hypothetical protein
VPIKVRGVGTILGESHVPSQRRRRDGKAGDQKGEELSVT